MTLPTLDSTERKALEHLVTWTRDAQQLRRAQALLWLDEGESVADIADRNRVTARGQLGSYKGDGPAVRG